MSRISFVLMACFLFAAASEARVRMTDDVRSLGEGSYLLIEDPLLIRKGTTSLRAMRSRAKADRQGRVLGPSCDIRLSKAQGYDIFKKNLMLKAGTKLYLRSDGVDLALVTEDQSLRIPLDCRHMVRQKKGLVATSRFTIRQFSSVFSFVGTLYMVPPDRKMAER
ncbi:MAG: hypothetical protein KF802_04770 [Bdellovibrionaceae bacterium]|nr:hypothetical protein [Pseudobdellovibrionaceae bacterium]